MSAFAVVDRFRRTTVASLIHDNLVAAFADLNSEKIKTAAFLRLSVHRAAA
jgi:hypothetical protein